MTKIKLCGLSRLRDIEAANALQPEYVGFVFAPQSRRFVDFETAAALKRRLSPSIRAVGVFVNEKPEEIAALLERGLIDAAQLHGDEDEGTVARLRALYGKPVIKAFRIQTEADIAAAKSSSADYVLLDSGTGTGTVFDWELLRHIRRPFFLAGGLDSGNVRRAVETFSPYAVDVSSGIETDGFKDFDKMAAFVAAVRQVK